MENWMLLRAVMALAIVIGLLFLCAAGLRRWGGRLGLTALPNPAGAVRKVQLLESAMLDSRHRLVRVKIDNREHAIVLGGASPVVVESKSSEGNG
jgi:flagellar protein FliO/FliZ